MHSIFETKVDIFYANFFCKKIPNISYLIIRRQRFFHFLSKCLYDFLSVVLKGNEELAKCQIILQRVFVFLL